jgi:hypothetical protein
VIIRPGAAADHDAIRKVMIRPLARYHPAFRGRAIYPPETFGIAC